MTTDVAWYWLRPVRVDSEPYVLHAFAGREQTPPPMSEYESTLYLAACRRYAFLPALAKWNDELPPLERCVDCALQMVQMKADGITVYAPLRRDELRAGNT